MIVLRQSELDLGRETTTAEFIAIYGPLRGEEILVAAINNKEHEAFLDAILGIELDSLTT